MVVVLLFWLNGVHWRLKPEVTPSDCRPFLYSHLITSKSFISNVRQDPLSIWSEKTIQHGFFPDRESFLVDPYWNSHSFLMERVFWLTPNGVLVLSWWRKICGWPLMEFWFFSDGESFLVDPKWSFGSFLMEKVFWLIPNGVLVLFWWREFSGWPLMEFWFFSDGESFLVDP